MMKPMLGLSLHVSMPTCVQVLGVCADAGAAKISAASTVVTIRMAFITIDLLVYFGASARAICCSNPSVTGRIWVVAARRRWITVGTISIGAGAVGRRGCSGGACIYCATICCAPRDASERKRRKGPPDNVDKHCGCAIGPGKIAFEDVDIKCELVALKLG